MVAATHVSVTRPVVEARLAALRQKMAARGVDAVLIRSTDAFLNEYVPTSTSSRVWITGFTGSMGDAVVTRDRAILVVDGRYALQAKKESPAYEARVVPLGTSIEHGWLALLDELAAQGVRSVAVETERVPVSLMQLLTGAAATAKLGVVPTVPSLVEEVRADAGEAPPKPKGVVRPIAPTLAGRTVQERLALVRDVFPQRGVDGLLVVPLDEVAWITNLRGDAFPFQATFPARAVVFADEVALAADPASLVDGAQAEKPVSFVGEGGLAAVVAARAKSGVKLGFDPTSTPEAVRAALHAAGATLVPVESPFPRLRAKKTAQELDHMADSFRRADDVVSQVATWLSTSVSKGARVTEADVAKKTEELFAKSGAFGLSFKVISAAGKNGAIIHHSIPDDERPIGEGELFLLDTGAYYEGGYATDLTRTFLVGKRTVKATEEQKRLYTSVLKAAIAGMTARIPRGATGEQLDAIVRDALWRRGLDYGHGTGHGVGVNVHEFPPRIAPGVRAVVEEGHVFSIEPGVYIEGTGGVRIENLVTCVADPESARFLRIQPLTFSPLDPRLIDKAALTDHEHRFLAWFAARRKRTQARDDVLPPTY